MKLAKKQFTCLCMMFAAGSLWPDIAAAAENGLMNISADPLADDPLHSGHEWIPVSEAYLDSMRGGFDTGTGLRFSFGIRREVYMNKNLVASTNLNIADINGATSEQNQEMNAARMLYLIQNGAGNHFDSDAMSQSAASIVVQNTLNQQDIRSLTILNARVNSLELLKNFNIQSALAEAIGQSVGAR